MKLSMSRKKEIIKIKVKINESENRQIIEEFNETKNCLFEMISKTDKLPSQKGKREIAQIFNDSNEREDRSYGC